MYSIVLVKMQIKQSDIGYILTRTTVNCKKRKFHITHKHVNLIVHLEKYLKL